MTNNFLTKQYVDEYSLNMPETKDVKVSVPTSLYSEYQRSVSNNHRICKWITSLDCDDNSDDSDNDVDESNELEPIYPDNELLSKTLRLTYETLYQNIASLNNHTDMIDSRYFIRTYFLDETRTITVTTNMHNLGSIVSTISGDTGFDKVLVKTTTYVKSSHINVVYTYGGDN